MSRLDGGEGLRCDLEASAEPPLLKVELGGKVEWRRRREEAKRRVLNMWEELGFRHMWETMGSPKNKKEFNF